MKRQTEIFCLNLRITLETLWYNNVSLHNLGGCIMSVLLTEHFLDPTFSGENLEQVYL